MLLFVITGVLLCSQQSASQLVSCYMEFDYQTGQCSRFLSAEVEQSDCCLNPAYGFINEAGKCQSCGSAQWSAWSSWSSCTVSCLEGVRQRRRTCYGIGECDGKERLQTAPCSELECCPVEGGWSEWSPWQPCSVTCESGVKVRQRSCSNPPPICGGGCEGRSTETYACYTNMVCPTHGSWSSWGSWSSCSNSCKMEGSQKLPIKHRSQTCSNPPPSSNPPGKDCPGPGVETVECPELPFCPVDGSWGSWRSSGGCSVTCGLGLRPQTRECNNPAPKHGGMPCPGEETKHQVCNTHQHCPIDGRWSEWSAWSDCVRHGRKIECKKLPGMQRRTRTCEGREYEGRFCDGDIVQNQACYNVRRCRLEKGNWAEWSPWGFCHPPCGSNAEKTRTKVCNSPFPTDYPMLVGLNKDEPTAMTTENTDFAVPITFNTTGRYSTGLKLCCISKRICFIGVSA
ncbi:properdin-like [Huso huso]|uniref:Properdin-like n=1 Tax=Huso huso TaxID=61971 RepID=A0ABR0Y3N1_HUSHU